MTPSGLTPNRAYHYQLETSNAGGTTRQIYSDDDPPAAPAPDPVPAPALVATAAPELVPAPVAAPAPAPIELTPVGGLPAPEPALTPSPELLPVDEVELVGEREFTGTGYEEIAGLDISGSRSISLEVDVELHEDSNQDQTFFSQYLNGTGLVLEVVHHWGIGGKGVTATRGGRKGAGDPLKGQLSSVRYKLGLPD